MNKNRSPIGKILFCLSDIIVAEDQCVLLDVLDAQGANAGSMMIQATNQHEDVHEIDFKLKMPWPAGASSRDRMQFVIEKESHMNGKLSPVYCSKPVGE